MATIVCFHAHPDDEAISTGGIIAKYSAAGHRVVVVYATGGEHGDMPYGLLEPGESVAERRRREVQTSAAALGVARIAWLGYCDSGMMGTPENDAPESFWQADVDEAAARLAAILAEESADVLTCYDERGNYGHPDHIQVHRVGHAAAAKASTPKLYEATMNRDHLVAWMRAALADATEVPPGTPSIEEVEQIGMPASVITTTVDVRPQVPAKLASLAAHQSQVIDTAFFLSMPVEVFTDVFGFEWFIRVGAPEGTVEDDLLAGL
jgi:LmbE family N-acetylglucosaminyl deacetylase